MAPRSDERSARTAGARRRGSDRPDGPGDRRAPLASLLPATGGGALLLGGLLLVGIARPGLVARHGAPSFAHVPGPGAEVETRPGAEVDAGASAQAAVQAATRPVAEAVRGGAVKSTVRAFHAALAAGDSTRALDLLHEDVRVFENGHAETLSEYRAGHLAADMEFSASVERRVLSERVFGDAGDEDGSPGPAVYLGEHRTAGTFRGEEVESRGTETVVLVATADGWRILHIHWSSR